MIHIIPPHLRKKGSKEPQKEKMYSYHEVENLIISAILSLNNSPIIRASSINIKCVPDCRYRRLIVDVHGKSVFGEDLYTRHEVTIEWSEK